MFHLRSGKIGVMTKFAQWLNINPGMSKRLRMRLGINPTNISNVKHERRPMPGYWMPVVISLAGGALTYEDLVTENLKHRNRP